MQGMERLALEVVAIERPFDGVARLLGRIAPRDPAAWALPNQAVRLEVPDPDGGPALSRVYTVRRFAAGLVEIDFVLHGATSPVMRWLAGLAPGDVAWMTGPRQHALAWGPEGGPVAVFADDTALPAVAAMLACWPAGVEGVLWLEAAGPGAIDELPAVPGLRVVSLLRAPGVAAGTGGALLAAARGLAGPVARVWAAGERQEMRALRAHFQAAGMARGALQVLGYWRRGVSSSEIDRQRLADYTALRARGLTLADLDDAELPI